MSSISPARAADGPATPSLLVLGESFRWHGHELTPMGHVRIGHAHGYWDEWWVMEGGDGLWISVDEGDIAIEKELSGGSLPAIAWSDVRLGAPLRIGDALLIVSEIGEGRVQAVRGELPEIPTVGQRFDYAHLSGPLSILVTLEHEKGEITATEGHWVDPFEIERA
ncbi:MAG: DUF4178 domain-containing protein [Geminicoccaceae bacterium]